MDHEGVAVTVTIALILAGVGFISYHAYPELFQKPAVIQQCKDGTEKPVEQRPSPATTLGVNK